MVRPKIDRLLVQANLQINNIEESDLSEIID